MTDSTARRAPAHAHSAKRGKVKWYNPDKGYGFVTLEDGSDAFLHGSVLQESGRASVPAGASVVVDAGMDAQGRLQVTYVASVDETTATPQSAPARRAPPLTGPVNEVPGILKWYSALKGYGFVTPLDGGKDIFLHATALSRSGIAAPAAGTPMVVGVRAGRSGPEAETVRLA